MSIQRPLITIAIPTVERLDYLKEAVRSALAQTYEPIEVLIGDDGRTTTIEEWSREIAGIDARVRYQRNQRTLGLAGNWNALADGACGEFLVIIGDDDRLLPEFVEKLSSLVQPAAAVVFSNHYLIDYKGVRLDEESHRLTARYHRDELPAGEIVSPAICVWRNSVPMSAALIRTREVQRLRFKEDLNTPEIEFFARLAQVGGRFFFTPEYLAEYRVHDKSETAVGLRGEDLVKYLAPISVADEVEPYKKEFMSSLLINAVTCCLQQGNRDLARQLLNHEYYPRLHFRRPKGAGKRSAAQPTSLAAVRRTLRELLTRQIQGLCIWLPTSLGGPTYRLFQLTRSRLPGLS